MIIGIIGKNRIEYIKAFHDTVGYLTISSIWAQCAQKKETNLVLNVLDVKLRNTFETIK